MVGTKKRVTVSEAEVHIQASYNNTIVTLTDLNGNSLSWKSAGSTGAKGSKKSTPYAAQLAGAAVAKVAVEQFKVKSVKVYVKGPGPGRESAIRAFSSFGIVVIEITDKTRSPHNGCRAKKKRRV